MGYQSDIKTSDTGGNLSQEVILIPDKDINLDSVFYVNNQKRYAITNGNLLTNIDIRLRRKNGPGQINGAVLKLPVPLGVDSVISWTTLSTEGNPIFCRMSGFGVITIQGELTSVLDEVVLNFPPFVAELPLKVPDTPVFNVPSP